MKVLCLIDKPDQMSPDDRWLWNYLPEADDEVEFLFVRAGADKFAKWGKIFTYYPPYWWLGVRAFLKTRNSDYDVVVAWEGKTGFPYAVMRSLFGQKRPSLVILAFNIRGLIKHFMGLARFGMRSVTKTVVFTPGEVKKYQQLLGLEADAVTFQPQGWYDLLAAPSENGQAPADPFIFASGRSYRDYATLAQAVAPLEIPTLVSARQFNLQDVSLPPNMEILGWLSEDDFRAHLHQTRFYILPMQDIDHAGGDSSLMQAMSAGKAVIATRSASMEVYVEPGVTGLLVEPGDAAGLREAILELWQNPEKTAEMGRIARQRYEEMYTFGKFAERAYEVIKQAHHA